MNVQQIFVWDLRGQKSLSDIMSKVSLQQFSVFVVAWADAVFIYTDGPGIHCILMHPNVRFGVHQGEATLCISVTSSCYHLFG